MSTSRQWIKPQKLAISKSRLERVEFFKPPKASHLEYLPSTRLRFFTFITPKQIDNQLAPHEKGG
jgi:hypothetical protein